MTRPTLYAIILALSFACGAHFCGEGPSVWHHAHTSPAPSADVHYK